MNEQKERPTAHNQKQNPYGATFDREGQLTLPSSMIGRCRRAIWYEATEAEPTNPPTSKAMTAIEMANAMKPAIANGLNRNGWSISLGNSEQSDTRQVTIADNIIARARPDLVFKIPGPDDQPADQQERADQQPHVVVIRSLTAGNFTRWQAQGAELTAADAVLQAAVNTFAEFSEPRPIIYLAMNTSNRETDFEVIPAHRVDQALHQVISWSSSLSRHLQDNGPDPETLPDQDYKANQWQCRNCRFFDLCEPEEPPNPETDRKDDQALPEEVIPVTAAEAQRALNTYENLQPRIKDMETTKSEALQTLQAFLDQQDLKEIKMKGAAKQRSIKIINASKNNVNHKKLNELLDPVTRQEIYSITEYSYVRVY